jgi:hypothetical protein
MITKKAVIFEITALIFIAVLKNIVDFYTLLIGVEGAKTPAGEAVSGDLSGGTTRRLPVRPRKAQRLERKSTDNFNKAIFMK